MRVLSSLLLGTLLAITLSAHADDLAGYDSGNLGTNQYVGQEFTVSGTGTFTDITFNFFAQNKTTEVAAGTGFLLSEEYLGTPGDLSSSTPGYIASVAGSGGSYDFGSTATLVAGDTYYLYSNVNDSVVGQGAATGTSFVAFSGDFMADNGELDDFQVTGTPTTSLAATPEPASLILLCTSLAGIAEAVRRRRA